MISLNFLQVQGKVSLHIKFPTVRGESNWCEENIHFTAYKINMRFLSSFFIHRQHCKSTVYLTTWV
jgi:hypothetical protein